MINSAEHSLLGKPVEYQSQYDPSLLYPIARAQQREVLNLDNNLVPFTGIDIWNAYELSWLDLRGRPRVSLAEFRIPSDSTHIIESKSFKLYLNSYMQTRFADAETVRTQISKDISNAAGASVSVILISPHLNTANQHDELDGFLIDDVPVDIDHYGPPKPAFLKADQDDVVEEKLVSHLLKSNCPVTAQPDWASLQIYYRGPHIDRAGLLKYIVSFREHNDFHEQCVERIFSDIQQHCQPNKLSVYARYTRRGGLDINPFRASPGIAMPGNPRTARQ
jgi:7-cyano-7-deazaguanine reductase